MGAASSTTSASTANLSANDLLVYNVNRQKLFRTTIAIAAVYGAIAFLFLIIMLADTNNLSGLSSEYLPFTVTLIGGMLVTMIILVVQIMTYKPVSLQQPQISPNICPDYYVLKDTDTSDPASDYMAASSSVKNYMNYQCVPDPDVYDLMERQTGSTYAPILAVGDTNVLGQKMLYYDSDASKRVVGVQIPNSGASNSVAGVLASTGSQLYNSLLSKTSAVSGSNNLRCDYVYPQYMAYQDSINFPQTSNSLRCEYSRVCNIPWTGVCPAVPQ